MKRIAIAAGAALLLAGCGDHPVPEHGTVTDAKFTPAWTQVIPGTPPMCSGSGTSFTCTPGMPMQVIPWPDAWGLEITDLNNHDWKGTVEVSHDVYDRCNLGELWPDCSDPRTGDVRPK